MKDKTINDKKEEKDSIDKGPQKDKHINQYGTKDEKRGIGSVKNS